MSTVTMWFDPTCPFTWRTSRWLREVAPRRGSQVDWRVMSLAILNEGSDEPEPYASRHQWSRTVQRVLVALDDPVSVDRLYTALGTRLHEHGEPYARQTLVAALDDAGLPAELIERADDETLDAAVTASHRAGQERAGQDSGSPVVAVGDGPGYFGPIVGGALEGGAGERLFDALCLLSTVPQFSELKRAR